MEYQKDINLLDNKLDQPSKFETKHWVEKTNDDLPETYNTNSQMKFKKSMLMSSLCDYSDAYILVSRTIIITGTGDDVAARQGKEINK